MLLTNSLSTLAIVLLLLVLGHQGSASAEPGEEELQPTINTPGNINFINNIIVYMIAIG